ncbi:MAG: hypothetical protein O3A95_07480 [Planctomycetota bacterium]|nr:hypothetical protein [Planctomycetota bacterium]MDA1114125.1 hypothetical protein [Planctomycetota bacterium]
MLALLTLTFLSAPLTTDLAVMTPLALSLQAPDLKEEFARFDAILKSKTDEGEAINLMDTFVGFHREAQGKIDSIDDSISIGEGDKKALLNDRKVQLKFQNTLAEKVYSAMTHKGRKALTEANLQLFKASAYTLGQMGSVGAHYLWKAFENKKFKAEPDFLGLCLEQVGYTHAYEEFTEELTALLDHHEYLFIAKASEALAQFGGAPGSLRHDAVERLTQLLSQNWESTITNKTDEEAQKKYRQTGQAMRNALEALTGTSQSDPQAWTTWWNENKNDKEIWADHDE